MAPELRGSWLERRQGSPMRTTSSPHRELTRCGRGKQRTKADLSRSKAVTRFREPRSRSRSNSRCNCSEMPLEKTNGGGTLRR